MKKKKILVVINSLRIGGAERSCVSFLKSLPENRYEIDLMLLSCKGFLLKELPAWVNIVPAPPTYACLVHKLKEWRFYIKRSPLLWIKKSIRSQKAKRQPGIHIIQGLYQQWRSDLPVLEKEYDVAIGYLEGFCNYIVSEKVRAGRKILWIHSNYDDLGYNYTFDAGYFSKADVVATMSPNACQSLRQNFPHLADRVWFIENITDAKVVKDMAMQRIAEENLTEFDGLKIVSCGRLAPQKAYERAIEAAALIQKEGIPFKWVIIGEGPERKKLECLQKSMGLNGNLCLIGMRENPYPYMKWCDMLIVTSTYEGRPMVIDEAKILGIPVVTTNYTTAIDAVEHEQTGLICEMTPEAIANAVIRLYNDKQFRERIHRNLLDTCCGNQKEIVKYIAAIEGAGSYIHTK